MHLRGTTVDTEILTASAFAPEPVTTASAMQWPLREDSAHFEADQADRLFVVINRSLRDIESEQIARVETLAEEAYQTAEEIAEALAEAGVSRQKILAQKPWAGRCLPQARPPRSKKRFANSTKP